MAKYGAFVYGSGTLYGADEDPVILPAPTGLITWIFQVDWTNSGSFSGYNEAQNMKGLPSSVIRGRSYYIGQDGQGFEPFQIGRFSISLENTSGRYDPYTQVNIRPGRKCQLAIYDNANKTTKVLFTGFIEEIRPQNDGSNTVIIDVVDGMNFLNGFEVSTAEVKYRTNISTAINDVLTLAEWDGSKEIDDNSQPIVSFALDNDDAGSTLAELSNASLGNFFIDRFGKAVYYSRSHNSQATHTIDQTQVLSDIPTSTPWENVRNAVSVTAIKPFKGALQNVLSVSPIKINIPVNRTVTFDLDGEWIDIVYEGIAASTMPGGGGMDMTQAVVVSYTIGKKSVTFTFDTSIGGYVNDIYLKGRRLEPKKITSRSSDTTSRANYGSRRFNLESEWLQNLNHAESFASTILAALKDPSKAPVITIEGRPDIQFDFELLDKVAFESTTLTIDETFYIGQIEYRVIENSELNTCQQVQTILTLQPLIYDDTAIDDDPYDPGLPEVPVNPSGPTYPGGPEPEEVPIECKTDREAPPNGPYWLLYPNFAYDLVTNLSTQKQITIPFQTVIRMGTSVYPTKVVLHARRLIWIASQWYYTESMEFFEIWAVGTDGSELFKADVVTAEGDYITAVFHPEFGTTVGGIKIKTLLAPEYDFNLGYTFTFGSGPQGWVPAPYGGGAEGDPTLPTSLSTLYDPSTYLWSGGQLLLKNVVNGWHSNSWVYYPNVPVYGQAGASVSGLITIAPSNCFLGFGTLYTDGTWEYSGWGAAGAPTKTITKACGAANYGKRVKCFQINTNQYWSSNWTYLDSVHAEGWSLTPSNTLNLRVYSATISNVCAVE